jgi:recombination protein RecA
MFINQLRQKIGIVCGNPETTTGGNALKFYASVRVDIRRIGKVERGGETIGNRLRAKVVKNKLAPPFKETEFDLIFGEGIDSNAELVELGEKTGVLVKAGAWYSFEGAHVGQGKQKTAEYVRDNPHVALRIRLAMAGTNTLQNNVIATVVGADNAAKEGEK